MLKECEECGVEFKVDTTKRNWKCIKFCSELCQKARLARKKREKYKAQEWPQKRECVRCGTEFLVKGPNSSNQIYCTEKCRRDVYEEQRLAEVESRRKAKICPECKTAFIPSKQHQKKQIYCSKYCYYKALRRDSIPAENRYSNSIEFQRAKRLVAKRDNGKCVFCGDNIKVHVHHLDFSGAKKKSNNHPDNLATLCIKCHKAIHHVALVPHGDGWAIKGSIFNILKLEGSLKIIP